MTKPKAKTGGGSMMVSDPAYEARKERARARQAEMSTSGRDIGGIPEVVDPERRERAMADFRFFCETYFAEVFSLEWSPDHLIVIEKLNAVVLHGGLFALAMPRASGKTSLCEVACVWAVLLGIHEFVALIGAEERHATEMMDSIKSELENNDLLLEDFPEAVYPIQCLEGIHQRASGQLCGGKRTSIKWTEKEIRIPTIDGSNASGAVIRVAGLTGRIRGMKYKRADGRAVRPSLVLIDDPQTDESARSPSQCAQRERVLAGAILGLAGPGKKIAGLASVTVIRPDDMADRLVNRDLHPQWQGVRMQMVYEFPTNEGLWAEYGEIREASLRDGQGIKLATEFYAANRKAMDEGARVAWEARYNPEELSALQHAMNLKFQDEPAFFAEYQNEPLPDEAPDAEMMSVTEIAEKTNGMEQHQIPIDCTKLVMFIDVHGAALYYMVAAFSDAFTGYVVDYGTEPDQKLPPGAHFTLRDVRRTLKQAAPRAGGEGAIYAGLERLAEAKLGIEWSRDDGAMMRIDRCLIDANWGDSTDVVYQFSRQSKFSAQVMPSHGKYVGASSVPFSEYKRRPGERNGHNWRVPNVTGKRAVRHVLYDTNFWKSFVHKRLGVSIGDSGCLSLWGSKPDRHQLLAEHIAAEYRIRTEGRGRTVDEWKMRASKVDNHWLDTLVGTHVAASMQGAALTGMKKGGGEKKRRRRLKLSEMQAGRKQ